MEHLPPALVQRNQLILQKRASVLAKATEGPADDDGVDWHMRLELHTIHLALDRIRQGVYGICNDCEGYIAQRRLEALPYAERCLSCQHTHEKNGGDLPGNRYAALEEEQD